MMNGREKSDPATVAKKSANEAGRPGEEWMEPRAGAEGNADRQSTLRTQDRAGVSQALGRIRKAARQSKTEKFTALLHHVDVRLLRESYLSLRRDASPGSDGVTWEAYGLDLESKLMDLHERVHRRAAGHLDRAVTLTTRPSRMRSAPPFATRRGQHQWDTDLWVNRGSQRYGR
jgi:RNA-directed DNA polymerase